jgi:hypothetical protein
MMYYDEDGNLLAIVISKEQTENCKGIKFFTPSNVPVQVAYMRHPNGTDIAAHRHSPSRRTIDNTSEVLVVVKGVLLATLMGPWENQTLTLRAGDAIILLSGGHRFEILEDAELWEIKQGPWQESEKVMLS